MFFIQEVFLPIFVRFLLPEQRSPSNTRFSRRRPKGRLKMLGCGGREPPPTHRRRGRISRQLISVASPPNLWHFFIMTIDDDPLLLMMMVIYHPRIFVFPSTNFHRFPSNNSPAFLQDVSPFFQQIALLATLDFRAGGLNTNWNCEGVGGKSPPPTPPPMWWYIVCGHCF